MKKIVIIIVIVIIGILIGWNFLKFYSQKENNQDLEIEVPKVDEKEDPIEKEEEYVDNNPIKIGIYIVENGKRRLLTDYSHSWNPEVVIGQFFVAPTNEQFIGGGTFKNVWQEYAKQYESINEYKIGYQIKFTLNTEEVIEQVILSPDDAYNMFPKVMVFLYDDINYNKATKYYHTTMDTLYDYTKLTSIKLVGDVESKNIISPIELTAFTYKDENDFEPTTKKYRGNSSYTIIINKK